MDHNLGLREQEHVDRVDRRGDDVLRVLRIYQLADWWEHLSHQCLVLGLLQLVRTVLDDDGDSVHAVFEDSRIVGRLSN